MTTTFTRSSGRRAAINGLAVVGFIALLATGVSLAIYSARFLPKAATGINAAAVYLSSLFTPHTADNLEVVPQSVSFGDTGLIATSTTATTTTTTVPATVPSRPVTAGTQTTNVYPAGAAAALYGQSDLTVSAATTGYLTSDSTTSFVASPTVPVNMKPAIKFTVANAGTNVSGAWAFTANLPTDPSFLFSSAKQESLLPGDRIDYVLGFDRPSSGNGKLITVTLDSGSDVNESSESNNVIVRSIDIQN